MRRGERNRLNSVSEKLNETFVCDIMRSGAREEEVLFLQSGVSNVASWMTLLLSDGYLFNPFSSNSGKKKKEKKIWKKKDYKNEGKKAKAIKAKRQKKNVKEKKRL